MNLKLIDAVKRVSDYDNADFILLLFEIPTEQVDFCIKSIQNQIILIRSNQIEIRSRSYVSANMQLNLNTNLSSYS